MSDVDNKVKMIVEGLLLAAGRPLTLDNIIQVFARGEKPDKKELKSVMEAIAADCDDRGFELKQVASGYRFQVKQELSEWVAKLWEERPPRYTRALLETLALIAYRQPITRGDIEEIRGVAVSPNIIRTLLDREWVRVVGHRDVPGRPAMFATTKQFLDYFNLKSLQELPPLSDVKELVQADPEIDLAEELAKQRVIDLPEDDLDSEERVNTEAEKAELLAEEEALELSRKPLDEILGLNPAEDAANDEEDSEADAEEGTHEAAGEDAEAVAEVAEEESEEESADDANVAQFPQQESESDPVDDSESEVEESNEEIHNADILEFSIEEVEDKNGH